MFIPRIYKWVVIPRPESLSEEVRFYVTIEGRFYLEGSYRAEQGTSSGLVKVLIYVRS